MLTVEHADNRADVKAGVFLVHYTFAAREVVLTFRPTTVFMKKSLAAGSSDVRSPYVYYLYRPPRSNVNGKQDCGNT